MAQTKLLIVQYLLSVQLMVCLSLTTLPLETPLTSDDRVFVTADLVPGGSCVPKRGIIFFQKSTGNAPFRFDFRHNNQQVSRWSQQNSVRSTNEFSGGWPLGDGQTAEHMEFEFGFSATSVDIVINGNDFATFDFKYGWTVTDIAEIVLKNLDTCTTFTGVWVSPRPGVQWGPGRGLSSPGGYRLDLPSALYASETLATPVDCAVRASELNMVAVSYDHNTHICQLFTAAGQPSTDADSSYIVARQKLFP